MGCDCDKRKLAPDNGVSGGTVFVRIPVRDGFDPLACHDCLEKHLAKAAEQAREVAEDSLRRSERILCIGNLGCAEDHARALGLVDLADAIRAARRSFQHGDVLAPLVLVDRYISQSADTP